MPRKPVAFGHRPEGSPDYKVQVTTFRSDAQDDYTTHTLSFPDKAQAMAFAKRAGMEWTS